MSSRKAATEEELYDLERGAKEVGLTILIAAETRKQRQ